VRINRKSSQFFGARFVFPTLIGLRFDIQDLRFEIEKLEAGIASGYIDLAIIANGAIFQGTKGFIVADFNSRIDYSFPTNLLEHLLWGL